METHIVRIKLLIRTQMSCTIKDESRMITYNYADVILCRRLRVPKLKLIIKIPKLLLPINYQLNANRMLFSKQPGHAGQYSVVIDSY